MKKEIEASCKTSQRVKHLVREALARVKANPAAQKALDRVPERIAARSGICIRKIEIRHEKHTFRLLYLHRQEEGGIEYVTFFLVFSRRQNGYEAIDWEWLESFIAAEE